MSNYKMGISFVQCRVGDHFPLGIVTLAVETTPIKISNAIVSRFRPMSTYIKMNGVILNADIIMELHQ